jgi:hypothetical protein
MSVVPVCIWMLFHAHSLRGVQLGHGYLTRLAFNEIGDDKPPALSSANECVLGFNARGPLLKDALLKSGLPLEFHTFFIQISHKMYKIHTNFIRNSRGLSTK